jgi:hypothetical protein
MMTVDGGIGVHSHPPSRGIITIKAPILDGIFELIYKLPGSAHRLPPYGCRLRLTVV